MPKGYKREFSPIELEVDRGPDDSVHRVAVLPFIRHGDDLREWEVMVLERSLFRPQWMQKYEMSKGKRRVYDKALGKWRDIARRENIAAFSEEDREPVIHTSFREGLEELGLRRKNISTVFDAGDYLTRAASDLPLKQIPLRVMAVEVIDRNNFRISRDYSDVHPSWVSVGAFLTQCRVDHARPVENTLEGIRHAFSAGKLWQAGLSSPDTPSRYR